MSFRKVINQNKDQMLDVGLEGSFCFFFRRNYALKKISIWYIISRVHKLFLSPLFKGEKKYLGFNLKNLLGGRVFFGTGGLSYFKLTLLLKKTLKYIQNMKNLA